MDKRKKKSKPGKGEIEKQLRVIESLATRLPWIAVFVVFLSMILIMLEIYWYSQ